MPLTATEPSPYQPARAVSSSRRPAPLPGIPERIRWQPTVDELVPALVKLEALRGGRRGRAQPLAIAVGLGSWPLVMAALAGRDALRQHLLELGIVTLGLSAAIAALLGRLLRRTQATLLRVEVERLPEACTEQELFVARDGLSCPTPAGAVVTPFDAIEHVAVEPEALLISIRGMLGYAVPRASIIEGDPEAFAAALSRAIAESR